MDAFPVVCAITTWEFKWTLEGSAELELLVKIFSYLSNYLTVELFIFFKFNTSFTIS